MAGAFNRPYFRLTVFVSEFRQLRLVCREAVHRQRFVLHAVIKMAEFPNRGTTRRHRLTGGGVKLPKGALVKSHGAERLGKGTPRAYQVWIKEMNESEPLMRCREVPYIPSKAVE